MKDTSKNQDIHISSVYSDNENLVDLLENQHGLILLETDINDILHAVKQDRIKPNTAMKDLTEIYLDLSKCTEEGQKDIISLLPEPEHPMQYRFFWKFQYLHFSLALNKWIVQSDTGNKTELTYPDFIKLFEGGEGESQTFTKEDIEKVYRAGENKQTYYFKDTTVILPTTYEGVDG